ncbi:MAG: peptidylprolyl isomerase [Pseudomonadota bacterium]
MFSATQSNTAQKQTDEDGASEKQADSSSESSQENAEQKQLAKVINKPGKVTNRGGYIKILVNKSPITNFDIQNRVNFLKLRRMKGNRTKIAEQELIEQSVKLEEARVRRVLATDDMVDKAFATFAKRNRVGPAQLARELGKLGIGAAHFKEFIRSQISWRRAVQGRFQAETTQASERDIVTKLRKSGSAKPEVTEYNLQQIIFVVPENKRTKSAISLRRKEALAFRQKFSRCEDTVQQAKLLRDVSVVDKKRVMEPELPENWKEDIVNVDGNGTTRVKETSRGIEIMAICDKRVVNDDRAAQITSQSAEFESFNDKGSKLSQDYLEQLMKQSTIIYR